MSRTTRPIEKFLAEVDNVSYGSYVNYGDTMRVRDRYTHYISTSIRLQDKFKKRGFHLTHLEIVYFGESVSANSYDEFDLNEFIASSEFKDLKKGSVISFGNMWYKGTIVDFFDHEVVDGCAWVSRYCLREDGPPMTIEEMKAANQAHVPRSSVIIIPHPNSQSN